MTDTNPIHRIAIMGTAVIGARWTALCFKTNFQCGKDVQPIALDQT
jgi:hypothetical protein